MQLQQLDESQLDQRCQMINDDEVWEPHHFDIAEEDFYDYAERDWREPCLPKSELSGTETDVQIGVAKGTVAIICDF